MEMLLQMKLFSEDFVLSKTRFSLLIYSFYYMYSSDQKKVPVFILYYGRATVHRLNLNSEKNGRTTLVVRAFYGRTVFAINCANRSDVSTTGDPYFRFFARGNYYDDLG